MARPEEAEKPPGRRPPDQIRLYVFYEKARDLVKSNSQRLPKSSGIAG